MTTPPNGRTRCCKTTKNTDEPEFCPNRRRRMKRSLSSAISEAYGELYGEKIEQAAMENFFSFDLNRDGLISLEEAMVTNATEEDFKKVDKDNDGLVHPAEFDASLI